MASMSADLVRLPGDEGGEPQIVFTATTFFVFQSIASFRKAYSCRSTIRQKKEPRSGLVTVTVSPGRSGPTPCGVPV